MDEETRDYFERYYELQTDMSEFEKELISVSGKALLRSGRGNSDAAKLCKTLSYLKLQYIMLAKEHKEDPEFVQSILDRALSILK